MSPEFISLRIIRDVIRHNKSPGHADKTAQSATSMLTMK